LLTPLFPDGLKHSVRNFHSTAASTTVLSSLSVLFSGPQETFASYQCFANNSEGSALDSVDIYIQGMY
jgi:hypothetical protein